MNRLVCTSCDKPHGVPDSVNRSECIHCETRLVRRRNDELALDGPEPRESAEERDADRWIDEYRDEQTMDELA